MGKTSKKESQQQVDPQLAGDSTALVASLRHLFKGGQKPFDTGADIAAFTPQQKAAMGNTNAGLSAFGMGTVDPNEGLPTATVDPTSGVTGYSTGKVAKKRADRLPVGYQNLIKKFYEGMSQPAAPVSQPKPGGGKK